MDRGPTRRIDQPRPGHWLIRLVRGGPLVPACIRIVHTTCEPGAPENLMDRSPFLAAFVAGEPAELGRVWFSRGEPITAQEYEFRAAEAQWARAGASSYARAVPIARPTQKIDPLQVELPF